MDNDEAPKENAPKFDWALLQGGRHQGGMRQLQEHPPEPPAVDTARPPPTFARALRHSDTRDAKALRDRLRGQRGDTVEGTP
jgi:hypothetical protein